MKVLFPAIGFGITVWATFFHGEDRELSYEIVSKTELSALKGSNWPDIGLWYEKKVIENGGLLTVRIINTGNAPIYAKEFDGPITVQLKANSHFIAAKVIETKPKNLVPKISISTNSLGIDPMLLNSSDEILIQAIAQGELSDVDVNVRIGGIKKATSLIEETGKKHKNLSWLLLLYGVLSYTAYSLLGPVFFRSNTDTKTLTISRRGAILFVALVMLPGVGALMYFLDVQGMEIGWYLIFYYIGLVVLSETLAIPFRPKELKTDVGK